jgi:hypothetical protein
MTYRFSAYPAGHIAKSNDTSGMLERQIGKLGQSSQAHPLFQFNYPLIEAIVNQREQAVPVLYQHILQTPVEDVPKIVEQIYTAQRLAEAGVRGVEKLYGAVSRWNGHPDPYVQIYLAGLYRKLGLPETFGPLVAGLVREAVYHYPGRSLWLDPTEETGGAVLQLIAEKTAEETVKRLLPYLRPQAPQTPRAPLPSSALFIKV